MANFFADNPDLQYYLDRGIDWDPLVKLTEFGYRAQDGFDNAEDAIAVEPTVAFRRQDRVAGPRQGDKTPVEKSSVAHHQAAMGGRGARPQVVEAVVEAGRLDHRRPSVGAQHQDGLGHPRKDPPKAGQHPRSPAIESESAR